MADSLERMYNKGKAIFCFNFEKHLEDKEGFIRKFFEVNYFRFDDLNPYNRPFPFFESRCDLRNILNEHI